jgi:ATP-dependent Lon protease
MNEVPVLPLRAHVLFPGSRLRLEVSRHLSVAAIEALASHGVDLTAVSQRDRLRDHTHPRDLFPIRTRATIDQYEFTSYGMSVTLLGRERVHLELVETGTPLLARTIALDPTDSHPLEHLLRQYAETLDDALDEPIRSFGAVTCDIIAQAQQIAGGLP